MHFRYLDGRGRRTRDAAVLERIEELAIPPAWKDVWIASRAGAKLQATGYDKAGRKQYLYNPGYRAALEEAKYRFRPRIASARSSSTSSDLTRMPAFKRGGPRVFKYSWEGDVYNLTSKRLNDYVKISGRGAARFSRRSISPSVPPRRDFRSRNASRSGR